ncbi:hypothetical protein ACFYOT_37285 [Saccharothrix saharensis]|uniref:hypothetical protein n=1 Tax=Saccharothrix saharensis TaxID=571190 RepID=UPI003687B57B
MHATVERLAIGRRWPLPVDTADAGTPALPPHVRLMTDDQCPPLPPSVTADGPVRWIREPDARLPRLATVPGLLGPFTPTVAVRRVRR